MCIRDRVNPTKYDRHNDTTIVLERPVDMRIRGVRWLLDSGFFVRHDFANGVEVNGYCLDETTSEATDRGFMFSYLVSEKDIVPIAEVVYQDRYRRRAIGED